MTRLHFHGPIPPMAGLRPAGVLMVLVCASMVQAGLVITRLEEPPSGPGVWISATQFNAGGNTSVRLLPRENRDLKFDTVLNKYYFNRDRDLGQTFRTGPQRIKVEALTLRTGFGTHPFRPGAAGAEMFVQWLKVEGQPRLNNHGTTQYPPGTRWQTFNPQDPTTDDYLEGESFQNLRVVRGGNVPNLLPFRANPQGAPGNGQFIRFALTGDDQVVLEPNTTYAFLVGFVEPAPERAMTLANAFRGNYPDGHGIRREGSADTPAWFNPAASTPYTAAMFLSDTNNPQALVAALDKACFPRAFEQRVNDLTFGTMGLPDVCTYRDLQFYLEGQRVEERGGPASSAHSTVPTASGTTGSGEVPASLPRLVFPNDPAVVDVKRDLGARGDGRTDDTAALQKALDASSGRESDQRTKLVFLPNGVYRLTSNLVVRAGVGPWVYGESRDGVILRLDDGVPTNITALLRTHPSNTKETSADFFMRNFRNLTIDVGNNPHADGVRWYGNNSSSFKQARIIGTGKVGIHAGFLGQNGPSLIQDAVVEGSFETGVRCAWSWGQTLSRVTVRNARKVGVYVNATAVAIEDLVVENTPIALHNEYPNDWTWWGGVVALVRGRFTGNDPTQPAITNTSVLYAREVTAAGFKQVLMSTTPGGHQTGSTLREYVSHPVKKLFPDSPDTALALPIVREPVVPWETNLNRWVCINDFGAASGDNTDDTAAFQAAVDAAAREGKTTLYLRGIGGPDPNWYTLNGEVHIHGSVRHILGLGFGRVISGGQGRFILDDASAPVVQFQHLQAFGGRPAEVVNRSKTNTLVVESCDLRIVGAGRGDIFVTDCPSGIELNTAGQRLWARQLNPEGNSDTGLVRNHGGWLWALGVKHEGAGVRFLTDRGGATEILGLFNYTPDIATNDFRPMFDIKEASFSAMGVREISFGKTYPVKVRESRGAEVRSEKGGGWLGWAMYSGWSEPTPARPDSRNR
jgi:hypothetical protein